jgi:hypothetical protein
VVPETLECVARIPNGNLLRLGEMNPNGDPGMFWTCLVFILRRFGIHRIHFEEFGFICAC